MKRVKRLLCMAFLLVSIFGCLIFHASAAEVVASGYCGGEGDGTNLSWNLTDDGVLTITGNGAMKEYGTYYPYYAPWYSYRGSIKTVTIGNSVTTIGAGAFYSCTALTAVEIPNSVTTIYSAAFESCKSLTTVTIPDSVTTIWGWAFQNCTALTTVAIPDSVTTISDGAFQDCTALTTVTIPDSVTAIDNETFEGCTALTTVTIPDSVITIGYDAFRNCTALTTVSIPDCVSTIGKRAFYDCDSLTSVVIGDSVTAIGEQAFYSCESLTKVTIGDSVTTIGDYAFINCASLTTVTIPDSVTTIGKLAFSSCTALTAVTIGDSVTTIGKQAFYDCDSLTSVTIGDSVTTIDNYAFEGCVSLITVTIPDRVTTIGDYAFNRCFALTEISVSDENLAFCDVDGVLYNKAVTELICYPASRMATAYAIPDSVTTIDNYAFSGCTVLTAVEIPDSVTTIGDWAFSSCTALTTVTIGDNVTAISFGVFLNCEGLTKVTTGDGVTTIDNRAFEGCTSLITVTIPDSVTTIGDRAFRDCAALTTVTIPDSVTTIGNQAFYSCSNLTSVTIGDSVTTIGGEAFYSCDSLTSVTIGDSVTTIGPDAFAWCTALTAATIPDSVMTIGSSAFQGCDRLTAVTIGNSVTTIGDEAFYSCNSLTAVTIPNSVTTIGYDAFRNCDSLTSVVIGDSQPSVTIPDSVTTIGTRAFRDCDSLTSVVIGDSVTAIREQAFYDCDSLTSVVIGDSVTAIREQAFYDCDSLTAVTIPNSVTTISDYAFYDCDSLAVVTIGDSVRYIGEKAFDDCDSLVDVFFKGNGPSVTEASYYKHSFDKTVTFYYLYGTSGWTDSDSYDEEAGTWRGYKLVMIDNDPGDYQYFGHLDAYDHTGFITIDGTQYAMTEEFKNSPWNMAVMQSKTYLDAYVYVAYDLNDSNQITAARVMYGTLCTLKAWSDTTKVISTDLKPTMEFGKVYQLPLGNYQVSKAATAFPYDQMHKYIGKQVRIYTIGQQVFKVIPVTTGMGTVTTFDPLSTPQRLYIDGTAHPLASGDNGLVAKAQTAQFLEMTYVLYDDTIVEIYDIGQTYLSVSINNSMGGAYYVGEDIYFFLYRVFEDTEGNLIYTEPKNYGINISDGAIVKQKMKPTSYGDSVLHVYKAEKPGHVAFEFSELNPDLSDKGTPIKLALTITEDVYKGYRADEMPTQNYDLWNEHDVYNFYVHGMYVSDFSFDAIDDETYRYTFNVYNERYNPGVVEVYDANGTLIDVEVISKTENSAASLKSLFDQSVGVFKDIGKGNSLSFRSSLTAKHTPITVDVPMGGKVIVTDSCSASDACLVANCVDLAMSMAGLMNSAITFKDDAELDWVTKGLIMKTLASNVLSNVASNLRNTVLENYTSEWTEKQLIQLFVGLSGDLTKVFADLDIDLAEIAKDTADAAMFKSVQDFFGEAAGPAGLALKFVFAFNEATNVIGQTMHFCHSIDSISGYIIATPNVLERGFEEITSKDNVSVMSTNGSAIFNSNQIMQTGKLPAHLVDMKTMGIDAEDVDIYDVRLFENGSQVEFSEEVLVKIPVEDASTEYIAACYENGRWVPFDGQTEVKTDNGQTYMSLLTEELGTFALINKDKFQAHTIRVVSLEEGSVGLGSGFYAEGEDVTIIAVPKQGYSFSCWMENGEVVSTDASYTFKATSNRTLEAHYNRLSGFNLTLDSEGDDYINVVLLNGDWKEASLQLILATYDVHGRMIKCISRNEIIGESEDWEETITWDGNSDVAEIRGFVLDSVTKKPISPMWAYAISSN